MNLNVKEEIAIRDKAIALLENEIKVKNEMIKEQNTIIKTLEEHNDSVLRLEM